MDFLRELFFLLRNVPTLAHRYQAESLWATTSLVLAIATTLIKNNFLADASVTARLLTWFSRISYAATALAFIFAFIDLAKARLPFDDIVCDTVAVDAYYQPPAARTYDLLERLHCTNRSHNSIRNFAPIQDGYYERIPTWTVTYKLLGRPTVKLALVNQTEAELRKNTFPGGGTTLYVYRATTEFQPDLPAGEMIDLVYKIAARGAPVEIEAFSAAGTLFARGVEYNTLSYYVTIHAPPGYEIRLRDWGVIDPGGRPVAAETARQEKPQLSSTGALLQWKVSLARKHLRYMLKYAFESYLP